MENKNTNMRIWVYQSPRPLSVSEKEMIQNNAEAFLKTWNNHGTLLHSTIEILNDHFIIFSVDEQKVNASGCSIDQSVRFMREIGQVLNIDFFDRMKVAYEVEVNKIQTVHLNELSVLLSKGVITAQTIVYNNLITTSSQLENEWRIPLEQSWHASFAMQEKIAP